MSVKIYEILVQSRREKHQNSLNGFCLKTPCKKAFVIFNIFIVFFGLSKVACFYTACTEVII